jgi:serine/threonine protein phosphatase PrpC
MEDAISIINDIGVSNKVAVSCYGVFDGHNGDECVKYMS